jgi:hypothetical protein
VNAYHRCRAVGMMQLSTFRVILEAGAPGEQVPRYPHQFVHWKS